MVKVCMRYRFVPILSLLSFCMLVLPGFAAGDPGFLGKQGREGKVLSTPPGPTIGSIERVILSNMMTNGFDTKANKGQGALWINWHYGTKPLQTNFDSTGTPVGAGEDKFADLRYLHALWLYRSRFRSSHQVAQEVARYTRVVRFEFAGHPDGQAWIFDEFVDLYRLSKDAFYKQAARDEVGYLEKAFYHASQNAYYRVSRAHPRGYYRVDYALAAGCALLEAGKIFGHTPWTRDGKAILAFVSSHAYVAADHVFASEMDQVLLRNGALNPVETFFYERDTQGQVFDGARVHVSQVAQEVHSLLKAEQLTGDGTLKVLAQALLSPLDAHANPLGWWDGQHMGFYGSLHFPGKTIVHPGAPVVDKTVKESEGHLALLEAFQPASALIRGTYSSMEQAMLDVVTKSAYYKAGHGYLAVEASDWKPLVLSQGKREDWVAARAMSRALEVLVMVSFKVLP